MAPLTGFFGANSSGKTAILQFLLMIEQTNYRMTPFSPNSYNEFAMI
ncbi:hypothetical protein APA_1463 [Pseudanabaena sp. lw0831]|nr:hypothetical protein APA_1463 [Pseudanabaena sp. lw0831]